MVHSAKRAVVVELWEEEGSRTSEECSTLTCTGRKKESKRKEQLTDKEKEPPRLLIRQYFAVI